MTAFTIPGPWGGPRNASSDPAGVLLALLVSRWLGLALYTVVALIWLIPDLRIERALAERRQ